VSGLFSHEQVWDLSSYQANALHDRHWSPFLPKHVSQKS
jgi:hypothetical protein